MENMVIKDIQVETVDEEMNNTLVRDSAIELELLELFEDITLEEVVVNKACVGKVVGCKDMPASVVKKILTGVWRRLGPWRMKKCEEGVLGFFFQNEEDCSFILQKRPWLVNGVLLNIKPWPVEGEVRAGEFAVARFWVQIHGLPTRCLINDNSPIVAKKIGELADTDGSSKSEVVRRGYLRLWIDVWVAHPILAGFCLKADGKLESWVRFKYEKLPMICFNFGKLAHWDKVCHAPMTMVMPRSGKVVPLYGLWIKSDTGSSNCLNSKGKVVLKLELDSEEIPESDMYGRRRRGVWNRKESRRMPETGSSSEKGENRGGDTTEPLRQPRTTRRKDNRGDHEMLKAPSNFLNLPNPNFTNNQQREDLIPDLGPTLAQCIDVPHEWLCLSQNPHSFPEATPITWPNDDKEAQKPLSIPPNLSEMINHLLGNNRKRKAHTWLQPIPAVSYFSPSASPTKLVITNKNEVISKDAFCIGVGDEGSCSKSNARGRKYKSRNKAYPTRRSSGVKTRSGRKKCNVVDEQGMTRSGNNPSGLVRDSVADLIFLSETKVDKNAMVQVLNRIISLGNSEPWFLYYVYGTPYPSMKNDYWEWLTSKILGCTSNWVVIGDLNVIMEASKKEGGKRLHDKEGELLRDFLFDIGGVDLGCEGGFLTWQNSRNSLGRIRKRLDRVVANADWCIEFQKAKVVKFPILGSDHAPVCLQTTGERPKLRYPFHFLEVWPSRPDCESVIKDAWNRGEHLMGKLSSTKWDLKKWNQDVFGFCDRRLVTLRRQLADIQRIAISQDIIQREAEVQLEILEVEGRMDKIWRQKSREHWIRFGDANSKFFHSSTIINHRRNAINWIEDSPGIWLSERDAIGGYFNHHFKSLFESSGCIIDNEFTSLFEDRISEADNDLIGRKPDIEEIKEVVFKLHLLKAPGLDGFPGIFYRKYWHTVGPQLSDMVREFFATGVLDKKINHSFICLIRKTSQASKFDHFRPISLCNFSYKVIYRILTDRLKVVIDRVISPCQSAFMPGHWIAEASILAQKVLHAIKTPFIPKRGIRQGDPLSPLIFILCSEVLSKLIAKAESYGQILGVRIARNTIPITHLLYADDSIFFYHATVANSENLMKCIRTYEEWSGQRVNKQKSGLIFSPNTARRYRDEIKQRLGICCLKSSENYLGNPFFFSASKRRDYQFLKENFLNRLEGWKARHLAQAGRILARFWWLGNSDKSRYCALKSWNDLCQPKKCGGLGFRRMADVNVALLAKLFWLVLKGDDKMWVRILRDKYCSLLTPWNVEKKEMDSRGWKSILEARQICIKGAGLLVADGNIDIWDRPWVPHRSTEELKCGFKIRHNQSCWQIKDLFVSGMRVWN
uniref:Reverse transcriptase domain-containing protein n=1 Tax=Cannabis sativa TaxID=3483 RepID=A0A803PAD0_CANSA